MNARATSCFLEMYKEVYEENGEFETGKKGDEIPEVVRREEDSD